jgi:hypothetical protein
VKVLSLILISMLMGAAGIGAAMARPDDAGIGSPGTGPLGSGDSLQTQNQTCAQQGDGSGDPARDQTQDQEREMLQNQTRAQAQNQSCDPQGDPLQNRTRLSNASSLQEQIQERIREQAREQENLPDDTLQVVNQYAHANAFVHTLQYQNGQLGDIGPQVSQIAMQLNQSLQTEAQAQKTVQNRHAFVRALFGGDETAAGLLQQETVRTRQHIQEMNQLIEQGSLDSAFRAELRNQLQQIDQQQIELQQQAQKELQDRGLLGWIWK